MSPHHSIFRPHILDEEPGADAGDGARVRRLAAALRLQAAALGHARELRARLMRAGAWAAPT